jgi:urease accessory protein
MARTPCHFRGAIHNWSVGDFRYWHKAEIFHPSPGIPTDLSACGHFCHCSWPMKEADMLWSRIRCATLVGAGLVTSAGAASAHHLMGGKTPSTFADGILSGVGHPVIGPDHLAFLVSLGIAVGVGRLSPVTPFLFLLAMAFGVAAHVAAVNIPAAELIVAVSVLTAGILIALDWNIPSAAWAAIFGIAGFFHGYAYGESIYGAEPTPLVAYLVGLVVVQTALVVGIAFASRALWMSSRIGPRLAGAAICGVGFAVLVGQIIPGP